MVRGEYQIAEIGKKLERSAQQITSISDHYEDLRKARECLMRAESGLNSVLAHVRSVNFDQKDEASGRLWDAWQRAKLAMDHTDDAIVILTHSLDEPLIVAAYDSHVYIPRADSKFGDDKCLPKP